MDYTPGPWYFAPGLRREYMITDGKLKGDHIPPGTVWIANVKPVSSEDHHKANARLIAAAPDMLRALRLALIELGRDECHQEHSEAWQTINQLVKRIETGELLQAKGER